MGKPRRHDCLRAMDREKPTTAHDVFLTAVSRNAWVLQLGRRHALHCEEIKMARGKTPAVTSFESKQSAMRDEAEAWRKDWVRGFPHPIPFRRREVLSPAVRKERRTRTGNANSIRRASMKRWRRILRRRDDACVETREHNAAVRDQAESNPDRTTADIHDRI